MFYRHQSKMDSVSILSRNIMECQGIFIEYLQKRGNVADTLFGLSTLSNMQISVSSVEETGIGRTVKSLEVEGGDVGEAANVLLYMWSQIVAGDGGNGSGTEDSIRNSSTVSDILHYQAKLETYSKCKNSAKILEYISLLNAKSIIIAHLEITGIGKTVKSLEIIEGDAGEAAKALVAKWREMVARTDVTGEYEYSYRKKGAPSEAKYPSCQLPSTEDEHKTAYLSAAADGNSDNKSSKRKREFTVDANEPKPKTSKTFFESSTHSLRNDDSLSMAMSQKKQR